MPLSNEESFVNPQPPPNYRHQPVREDSNGQPMTNADFRKLLMTPAASTVRQESSVRNDIAALKSKKSNNDAAEKRKVKKLYYASLMKEVKEREEELSKKYRDRAKERREQGNKDDFVSTTANFKAVAPDARMGDNAEARRRIIEESKFLGGDLEHTHLVKGLDYALLQKVRAELENQTAGKDEEEEEKLKEPDDEDEEEQEDKIKQLQMKLESLKSDLKEEKQKEEAEDINKVVFKTKLAKNICRIVFKPPPPKINELFLPKRMAYVMDLEDEETDIPVTLTRSKADCPNQEMSTSVTTNDIVINKLTQILSYLRQDGKKDKKQKKKAKIEEVPQTSLKKELGVDLGIYDDIGDYVPERNAKKDTDKKIEDKNKKDDSLKKKAYFNTSKEEEKEEIPKEAAPTKENASSFIKNINEKYANKTSMPKKNEKDKKTYTGMSVKFDSDSYAECYPGTKAEEDVNIDSDDEPDYDKMDLGNKKGPVGRWDFDTAEDYSSYMSNKEALPKAAFQYGLKMAEGRKTRRVAVDAKTEKAKIEKEWSQISKIIDKRKNGELGGADYKKPKY